jgi:bacterioferritin-associated ferredoxin
MVVETEAIAEVAATVEVATAEAEAINAGRPPKTNGHFDPMQQGFLDSFQSVPRPSLESLENTTFPFASRHGLKYLWRCITNGSAVFMIVCSCNVLSDHDVRNAVGAAEQLPRNAKQIYGCLGCSAECGRCARTIKTIIDEALGACAQACCSGCPHSQAGTHEHSNTEFALAAS